MSQKKLAPMNGVPSYKFRFEKGYIQIIFNATTFSCHPPKCGFIWWDSFVVTTSNLNFAARPIFQLFIIVLYAVSQPLNTFTKMVLGISLRF